VKISYPVDPAISTSPLPFPVAQRREGPFPARLDRDPQPRNGYILPG